VLDGVSAHGGMLERRAIGGGNYDWVSAMNNLDIFTILA